MPIAPYITSAVLRNQPAGLAWNVVPTLTADLTEQSAQLDLVCQQVTSAIDGYLNQPLRAECVTETSIGPGHPRVSVDRDSGHPVLITRRWPVISVDAVQVSPAARLPPVWTRVPAEETLIRTPVLMPASGAPVTGPSGGNVVELGGRWLQPAWRGGWRVASSVTTGYPHTMLTGNVQAAGETLAVGDVTGWAGWCGVMLDGPATEWAQVTGASATTPKALPDGAGTVQAGPGTLTLAEPLRYAHEAGALFTALPLSVLQAAALSAAVAALENLAAVAVQSASGQLPGGLGSLAFESEALLYGFGRIM